MFGVKRDIKDFEFQQLCKFRLFKPIADSHKQRNSLLTCSSKYGLCFAGFGNSLLGFKSTDLLRLDEENIEQRSQNIIETLPLLKNFCLSGKLLNVAISCDDLVLAVVVEAATTVLYFFETKAFLNPGDIGPFLVHSMEPGIQVKDLAWNPKMPELLAVCCSNGNVSMFKIAADVKVVAEVSVGASCLCWSPKGKQLVVGTKTGELKQFQPQLTITKNWPPPNNLGDGHHEVFDVVWVATYMFIAAYQIAGRRQPAVQIVNVPKAGDPSFINFRDPCFGAGDRDNKYNLELLIGWDMVVLASSNSLEAAIIARNLDTEKSWDHCMLEDSARAEVPLTAEKCDSFPVGLAIDYSNQKQIIMNEVEIGPFPVMLMLSTDGVLVPFFMVYKHKAAASMTVPIEALNPSGLRPQIPGVTQLPHIAQSPPANAATGTPAPAAPPPAMAAPAETSFKFGLFDQKPAENKPAAPVSSGPSALDQVQPAKPSLFGTPGTSVFGNMSGSPLMGQQPNVGSTSTSAPTAGQGLNQTQFGQSKPGLFSFTGSSTTTTTTFGLQPQQSQGILPTPSPEYKTGSGPDASAISSTTSAAEIKPLAGTSAPNSFSFSAQPFMQAPAVATSSAPVSTSTVPMFNPASNNKSNNEKPIPFGASTLPENNKPSIFGAASSNIGSNQPEFSAATTMGSPGQGFSFGAKAAPLPATTVTKPDTSGVSAQPKEPAKFEMSLPAQSTTPAKPLVPQNNVMRSASGAQKPVKRNESGGMVSNTEVERKPQTSTSEALESTFTKNILEEINHFQQEMNELKVRSKTCFSTVGTEDEKRFLKTKTEQMTGFCKEIKNITQIVHKEIDAEKLSVFEMFGILEECRVKNRYHQDVNYHKMLRLQPLDPASVDTMNMLRQQLMAVSNRLTDINTVLDEQWELFQKQRSTKNKKPSLSGNMPLQEINTASKFSPSGSNTIYQVIRKNHNIINEQKKVIENVHNSLKDLHLYDQKDAWSYRNLSPYKLGENKLSSLADTLLENKTQPEAETPQVTAISPLKQSQLREHLSKRVVPLVKSVSPDTSITLPTQSASKPASAVVNAQKQGFGLKPSTATAGGDDEISLIGQARSISTSTPLKPDTKTGLFPSIQISNYASGLNLEDISSAESVTGDDWPGVEEEDDDDDEEECEEEEEEDDDEEEEEEEDVEEYSALDIAEEKQTEAATTEDSSKSAQKLPTTASPPYVFGVADKLGASSSFLATTSTKVNQFTTTQVTKSPSLANTNKPQSQIFKPPEQSSTLGSLLATPKSSEESTSKGLFGNSTATFSFPGSKFNTSSANDLSKPLAPTTKHSIFSFSQENTGIGTAAAATDTKSAQNIFSFVPSSASTTTTATNEAVASNTSIPSAAATTKSKPISTSQGLSNLQMFNENPFQAPTEGFSFDGTSTGIESTGASFPQQHSPQTTATATAAVPLTAGLFTMPTTSIFKSFPPAGSTTSEVTTDKQNAVVSSATEVVSAAPTAVATAPAAQAVPATTSLTSNEAPLFSTLSNLPKLTSLKTEESLTFPPPSGLTAKSATVPPALSSITSPVANVVIPDATTAAASSTATPIMTTTPTNTISFTAPSIATAAATTTFSALASTSTTIPAAAAAVSTTITAAPTPPSTLFGAASASAPATAPSTFSVSTTTAFAAPTTNVFTMCFNTAAGTGNATSGIAGSTVSGNAPSGSAASIFANAANTLLGSPVQATNASTPSTVAEPFKSPTSQTSNLFTQSTFPTSSTGSPLAKGLFCQDTSGSSSTGLFGQVAGLPANTAIGGSNSIDDSSASNTGAAFSSAKTLFSQSKTGSVFGQASASPAASTKATGLFGQTSTPPMTAFNQSVFGSTDNTFKTNAFAQSAASTASVFGQAPSSSSVFGQPATTGSNSVSTGSIFGSTNNQSSTAPASTGGISAGLFSSGASTPFFSGLGGKPSEENANQNIFGNTSQVFNSGTTTQNAANLFGSQSPTSGFKSVALASPKLSSTFSFGSSNTGGSVASSGFSLSQQQQQQQANQPQQQQASAFGGSPSFSSSTSFGGAPAFGSKPAFGGGASFAGSTFGSGASQIFNSSFSGGSTGVFGQQSPNATPGFANFAQSSSPTFGSLAQTSPVQGFNEAPSPPNTGFGGFASGSAFGGGSSGGFGSAPAFGHSASFTDYRS
ncbi:nuclear pore complex protein Nup214 isoform X1 [Octopus sinensis]|uniref:Nuclear pore complex protein Nup214 isoform X1 n=1 Tax=Octopus sinensis TaxID=2607531 RepID=A0A6P7SN50_9MOLL|nr:nuclear pore complex protein Nup214 isoform X1 [Octopus sinensis]